MSVSSQPIDFFRLISQNRRPARVVVTAGMPYANGPLHLGHLAGAHLPADIFARWMKMLLGPQQVLFVCGTDDHGSTSELAAMQAGVPIRDFIDQVHAQQEKTLERYQIGLDIYSGTSREDCFPLQVSLAHYFLSRLQENGLLEKRTSAQWYDTELQRFLPDRLVRGRCPNPKCDNDDAYSDECDKCGHQHEPNQLLNPRSAITGAVPIMRETVHWWINMAAVSETLRVWIQGKRDSWRPAVVAQTLEKVMPSIRFERQHELAYRELKGTLPRHKLRYAAGGSCVLQFESADELDRGSEILRTAGIAVARVDEWAHRPITRDVSWGVPIATDLDNDLAGKTLYVWPDSLIAPISFSRLALSRRGEAPDAYRSYWNDSNARVFQFLGQDNVFFYVLMQGAMWLGIQHDPHRMPVEGEFQLTEVFSNFHLLVNGEKMSKSRGNFIAADELLSERGYSADQIRYYVALLGLSEKSSNFDFARLDERNRFLAGPMNAAFERPISAAHSKFGGRVPEGTLLEGIESKTIRMIQRYIQAMDRADYPGLLFEIENYARIINSLFAQHKPHDDRYPLVRRRNALFSAFYVLKNLMLMLHPFVPDTTLRLSQSLRLGPDVFSAKQFGTSIPAGHPIGEKQPYFPNTHDVCPAENGSAGRKPYDR